MIWNGGINTNYKMRSYMKNKDKLEEILEDETVMVFDNYDYDSALIGYTDDYRAVYDYDLMVEYLVKEQGFSYEDAVEWIDYNTIRALPYYGDKAPIIMYRLD